MVLAVSACGQGEIVSSDTDTAGLGGASTSVGPGSGGSPSSPGDPPPTSGPDGAQGSSSEPGSTSSPPVVETTGEPSCEVPTRIYPDADDDGFGDEAASVPSCEVPEGYVEVGGDCDDDDPESYPGAPERCGGTVDLDCDDTLPTLCSSCADLLTSGNGPRDGVYTIDIDGDEGPEAPLQVYCDQSTAGGGWTLLQRTVWDPALTDALQTTYLQWRTLSIGDPGAGAYRLRGDLWDDLQGLFDHMLRVELRRSDDGTSCAPLHYFGSSGVLDVTDEGTSVSGMVSEVPIVNAAEFSATDLGPSTTCVNDGNSVPWFFGSCCSTCPRYQGGYWNEAHPMVSYVNTTADGFGNLEPDVCSVPAEPTINGSVFRGANTMAYYVR